METIQPYEENDPFNPATAQSLAKLGTQPQILEAGMPVSIIPYVAGAAATAGKTLLPKLLAGLGKIGTGIAAGLGLGEVFADDEDLGPVPTFQTTLPGTVTPSQIHPYVAYEWDTKTAHFYRLTDGRIAVQRRNGLWKIYRPAKHIVISHNPRVGTLMRADARLNKLVKGLKLIKIRRK